MANKKRKSKGKKKSPAKAQLAHEVTIVPLKGSATTTALSSAPNATLDSILKSAKIFTDRKDLMVDGRPAGLATILAANAKIEVRERPAGS